jgi:hypothetical protein
MAKQWVGVEACVTESVLVWEVEGGLYGPWGIVIVIGDVTHGLFYRI